MKIRQPVINTFKRAGIDYEELAKSTDKIIVENRFSGDKCETVPLIAFLVNWVYMVSEEYERGIFTVKPADFDRIRYFILDIDPNVYSTCID